MKVAKSGNLNAQNATTGVVFDFVLLKVHQKISIKVQIARYF